MIGGSVRFSNHAAMSSSGVADAGGAADSSKRSRYQYNTCMNKAILPPSGIDHEKDRPHDLHHCAGIICAYHPGAGGPVDHIFTRDARLGLWLFVIPRHAGTVCICHAPKTIPAKPYRVRGIRRTGIGRRVVLGNSRAGCRIDSIAYYLWALHVSDPVLVRHQPNSGSGVCIGNIFQPLFGLRGVNPRGRLGNDKTWKGVLRLSLVLRSAAARPTYAVANQRSRHSLHWLVASVVWMDQCEQHMHLEYPMRALQNDRAGE